MDWTNVTADVSKILPTHFSKGRQGRKIDRIVLHHNAGRLSIDQIYNVWLTREASAHYQVEEAGRIGQLVWDADTAWHSGDWETNLRSIGIEHANCGGAPDWPISDATIEAGAHLVAALCRFYQLGRPAWGVNVFPHRAFSPTACPGQLADDLRDRYMRRAGEWYDQMTGAGESWRLEVTGVWDAKTGRRFREVMGLPLDCDWSVACKAMQYALSWQLDAYALKKATGVDRMPYNGVDDTITWKAWQAWWNQSSIPEGHRIPLSGACDAETIRAVQIALNHSWAGSRGFAVKP